MKKVTLILCAAFAFTAPKVLAQDAPASTAPPQMTADQEAMMQAWKAYMTPGDVHKMLAESTGEWKGDITMWMDPSAPPTKSTGTCNNKMILGGRYLESNSTGSYMNMPFEGKSLLAYDNAKKMFISTWIDNFGTGMMILKGTWDNATKTINFTGTEVDPMTGKDMPVRETFTIEGKGKQIMTMYMTTGGKEMKSMEIVYTRK